MSPGIPVLSGVLARLRGSAAAPPAVAEKEPAEQFREKLDAARERLRAEIPPVSDDE